MTTCSVRSCKSKSRKNEKLSFFRFPADPLIRKLWIERCDLNFLLQKDPVIVRRNYRVCELHFEDRMFLNPRLKNRVTFNAVPTLFNDSTLTEIEQKQEIKDDIELETLCPTCLNPIIEQKLNITSSFGNEGTYIMNCQTPSSEEDSSKTPIRVMSVYTDQTKLLNDLRSKDQEIKELKEKLNTMTQQLIEISTVEQMLKLCKLHLPPSLLLFVNTHLNHRNKKVKDFMYCNKILDLAKTLYLLCPQNIYNFLQTIIPIPTPCVLKRMSDIDEIHPKS